MTVARAAAAVMIVLCACARTSGTVEIPAEDLPFPVVRQALPTETAAPVGTFTIYLVMEGRLRSTQRTLTAEVGAAETSIRGLLAGPTAEDQRRRLSSELPTSVRMLGLVVEDGTAAVDLSAEFQEPAPHEQIALRVAQVVWTLTELPGIRSVRFAIDGEPIAVTTTDGTAVDRPVTRSDYADLSPSG